jgi:ribosomal protein S14
MAEELVVRSKDSCPHCGKPVGLSWWTLLPSSDRRRKLNCQACGRQYDLSDASKVSSMIGGLVGMGLTVLLLFGRIVKAGHGSKLFVGLGTVVVVLGFGLGAMALARITLRLEPKP